MTALMYKYKELTGCEEYEETYPNREFFMSYYGFDDEDEYEDEDD